MVNNINEMQLIGCLPRQNGATGTSDNIEVCSLAIGLMGDGQSKFSKHWERCGALIRENSGGGMDKFMPGRQFVEIALIQNVNAGTRISHHMDGYTVQKNIKTLGVLQPLGGIEQHRDI